MLDAQASDAAIRALETARAVRDVAKKRRGGSRHDAARSALDAVLALERVVNELRARTVESSAA